MTEWHNKSPQHQAPSHKEVMAFDERAYEQISAEILFSLPICVIMDLATASLYTREPMDALVQLQGYGLSPVPL